MDGRIDPSPDVLDALRPFAAEPALDARVSPLSLFPDLEPEDGAAAFRLPADQVLESMSDAFLFLDREWRVRYENGRAEEMHLRYGLSRLRVIGRTVWECFPFLAGTAYEREIRHAAATGRPREAEVHDAARGVWYECRFFPVQGGVAVYSRDVTERRRLQAEQALLAAAGEALAGSLDPEELLRRAAHLPLPLPLLGRWCFAFLIREDGRVEAMEGACLAPEKADVFAELVRLFTGAASDAHPLLAAARAGRSAVVPEFSEETLRQAGDDETYRALARALAPTTLMSVPLIARGRIVGGIAMATDEPGRRYGERDLALARELASRVALAFDNARLYRDATAAAARAEEARALLDALFRAAPIGLAFLDAELRYVQVNEALARANGVPADAHPGRTPAEVVPHCEAVIGPYLRRVLETGEPVVDLEWSAERPGAPGETRHWLESLYPVRGDSGAVLGVGVTLADVTALKRAEDVQRFLSEASRLIGPLRDRDAWLAQLPRAALPRLGDYCVIDLADEDGAVARSVIAHVDPRKEETARELRRRFPLEERERGFPVLRVLATGRPVVVLDVPDGYVEAAVPDEERRALLRALLPASYLVLPLEARGRVLGTMSFVMSEPGRRHTAGDVALAEELVRRVALALDNVRLFEAEQSAASRMARLFSITAALSGAVTPEQVAEVIVSHGMRDLGAHQGMMALPADGGASLELVRPRGVPADVVEAWGRFPLSSAVPLADAVRERRVVICQTLDEYDAAYPGLVAVTRRIGNRACAAVPLEVDGRVLGALAFTFAHEREFTGADRAFLQAIARQCAQALERSRLYESERAARAEAEGANRAKSDFLATMSHELRTPLNAIGGYTQLLEMGIHGPVTDAQADALRRIQRNQRHLLGLINDVLNFARIEGGHLSLRIGEVDVAAALSGVEALVAPQLAARALRYDCRMEGGPLSVRADPEKVQQVLLNLLSNAVKFTEPGGSVTLDASAADGGEWVDIRVRDTGVGIPEDRLEDVFEPFVQLDRGLTRTTEGTGLGLAISRDLARAMGGELRAGANPGGGSVFTLTLPAAALPVSR